MFSAAAYGVYTAAQFFATDVLSMILGAVLGIVVSVPFGLALGYLAVLSGQVVLAAAKRSTIRSGVQLWRITFSTVTCVTIVAASAVGAVFLDAMGRDFIYVGVIGIIAFISAYLYFPEGELMSEPAPSGG